MTPRENLAVVARRHEPADSLDFFPTPPWATRALLGTDWIEPLITRRQTVWDPCCGEGHMAGVLKERFSIVHASDVFDYGYGYPRDFLAGDPLDLDVEMPDWIIFNPPFGKLEDFILKALTQAREGVAVLCRLQALEGVRRFRHIWSQCEPTYCLPFAGRVPMHKGRWVVNGSTATAYMWLFWHKPVIGTRAMRTRWIAPDAQKNLHHPGDPVRFNGVYRRREIVGYDNDNEPIREDVFYTPAEWAAMGRAA